MRDAHERRQPGLGDSVNGLLLPTCAARNVPGEVDHWSVLTSFFRSGVLRVLFGLNAYPRKAPLAGSAASRMTW